MSCVLRITSDQLPERLPHMSMKSFRFDHGAAHFAVSVCEFDDLPGQVRDAITYLQINRSDILSLMESEGAEGVLDFPTENGGEGFRFKTLPRARGGRPGPCSRNFPVSARPR